MNQKEIDQLIQSTAAGKADAKVDQATSEFMDSQEVIPKNRFTFKKMILSFLIFLAIFISLIVPMAAAVFLESNEALYLKMQQNSWGQWFIVILSGVTLLTGGAILPISLWNFLESKNKYIKVFIVEVLFFLFYIIAIFAFLALPSLKYEDAIPNFQDYFKDFPVKEQELSQIMNDGDKWLAQKYSETQPTPIPKNAFVPLKINYIPESIEFYKSGTLEEDDVNLARHIDFYTCTDADTLAVYQYINPKLPIVLENYYVAGENTKIEKLKVFDNDAVLIYNEPTFNYQLFAFKGNNLFEVSGDAGCFENSGPREELLKIIESIN